MVKSRFSQGKPVVPVKLHPYPCHLLSIGLNSSPLPPSIPATTGVRVQPSLPLNPHHQQRSPPPISPSFSPSIGTTSRGRLHLSLPQSVPPAATASTSLSLNRYHQPRPPPPLSPSFHTNTLCSLGLGVTESDQGIFEQVLNGDLDFSSDPWPTISESAKDLAWRMLIRDPKKRLTAYQVLCHPWVQVDGIAPDKPLDYAVLSRMKQFSAMNKIKKMALRVTQVAC